MDDYISVQAFAGSLKYVIPAAAVGVLFLIAYLSGRRQGDTTDFFLGGRKVPGVIACLSFVATEVSAATITAVPATGYTENWQYLQYFVGSAIARVLVAFLFIPAFYRCECTTVYQFLQHRFGSATQYCGSGFFLVSRLLGSGVRLYAAAGAVAVLMGLDLWLAILLFTLVGIAFIAFGGVKAVVWTGAFEALVFFGVGFALLGFLYCQITGPIAPWLTGGDHDPLKVWNWTFNFSADSTLPGAMLNGLFVGLAVFGTDQELMQRLLTVRTRRASQQALLTTVVAALPLAVSYLGIGTLLYVFYRQNPGLAPPPGDSKQVLSIFALQAMPLAMQGLLLAGIVMASIDSPLASLSSSFVTDLYRPLIRKSASERHYLMVSRLGVAGFGLVLGYIAWLCKDVKNVLWLAFQVFSITGGSLLGVFLLGLLTRVRCNRANVAAMILSAMTTLSLLLLSREGLFVPGKLLNLGWDWLIVIGTLLTMVLSVLLSRVMDKPAKTSAPFISRKQREQAAEGVEV